MCFRNLPVHELPEHVQLHFLGQDEGEHEPSSDPIVMDDEAGEAAAGRVRCPLGCGAMVLLEELDSHEEAHRLEQHSRFVVTWPAGTG